MSTIYRKYRPQTFKDVVGQEHVVKTLENALKSGHVGHAYLFTGPRGVGKTSIARLLAKAVNCLDEKNKPCGVCANCKAIAQGHFIDLIEIDAASNRSVDDIRDLREKINFSPSVGKKKVYIIDEVHMLTKEAFNALLKTLEEPPSHSIFIFATTEIHKVPETIISRCQKFDFRLGKKEMIEKNLNQIAKAEGVKITDELMDLIYRSSGGSFRDAQSVFDQILPHLNKEDFSIEMAKKILNLTQSGEIDEFIELIKTKNLKQSLTVIEALDTRGIDFEHFLNSLIVRLRENAVEGAINGSDVTFELRAIRRLLVAVSDSKLSPIGALPLELAAIELCATGLAVETEKSLSGEEGSPSEKTVKTNAKDIKTEKTPPTNAKKFSVFSSEAKIAIIEQISQKNKPLANLLGSASWALLDDELVISVEYPFHKDTITNKNNFASICLAVDSVLEGKKQISCRIIKEEDLAQEIGEVFGFANE